MAEGAGREQMLQEPPPLSLKVTQWSLDIVWSSRGSHKGHSQGNGVDLCGPRAGPLFLTPFLLPPCSLLARLASLNIFCRGNQGSKDIHFQGLNPFLTDSKFKRITKNGGQLSPQSINLE